MSNKFAVGDVVVALKGHTGIGVVEGESYYVYSYSKDRVTKDFVRVTKEQEERQDGFGEWCFRIATPSEKVEFFAKHKELHPKYSAKHRDSFGEDYDNYRYMEDNETLVKDSDFFSDTAGNWYKIDGLAGKEVGEISSTTSFICMCPKDRAYGTIPAKNIVAPQPMKVKTSQITKSPQDMIITAGNFVTRNGEKAIVTGTINANYVTGLVEDTVLIWESKSGRAKSAIDNYYGLSNFDIVSEWKEPPASKEVTYYLYKSKTGAIFISDDPGLGSTIIGSKKLTINEGDKA